MIFGRDGLTFREVHLRDADKVVGPSLPCGRRVFMYIVY